MTQVTSLYVSIQSHNGVSAGGRPVVGSSRCGIEPLFLKRRHGDDTNGYHDTLFILFNKGVGFQMN